MVLFQVVVGARQWLLLRLLSWIEKELVLVSESRCRYEVDILIGQIDHGDLQLAIDVFRSPLGQYLFMVIISNF